MGKKVFNQKARQNPQEVVVDNSALQNVSMNEFSS